MKIMGRCRFDEGLLIQCIVGTEADLDLEFGVSATVVLGGVISGDYLSIKLFLKKFSASVIPETF